MSAKLAKFMNGANRFMNESCERIMNRKKSLLPFHKQLMNEYFMNEYHIQAMVRDNRIQEKTKGNRPATSNERGEHHVDVNV